MRNRGKLICDACATKLQYVREPYCLKCGKQLKTAEKAICDGCSRQKIVIDEGRAVFIYDDIMRKSIYRFKYNSRKEYAKYYASEIYKVHKDTIRRWNPDIIIPIPLHKSKMKSRGFNQAYLIAKEVSNLTKIPVKDNIIYRAKRTEKQKNLGENDRRGNAKNAFKMSSDGVQYLSAMLIDDIYTTGATINSAAKTLKDGGFTKVYSMSLSIGKDL